MRSNLGGGERDQVRIGPHEADVPRSGPPEGCRPRAVRRDLRSSSAQCSTVPPSKCPPRRTSVRPGPIGLVSPFPELHCGVRAHHPLTISCVQMDRHAPKRAAPLPHRGVVVRMGDRDRCDAAQALQHIDCGVVNQGDAVPQHIAGRGLRKDCALPDTERWGRLDRRKPRREAAELVAVRAPQCLQRGPGLARSWDELPLVGADRDTHRAEPRRADIACHRLLQMKAGMIAGYP